MDKYKPNSEGAVISCVKKWMAVAYVYARVL